MQAINDYLETNAERFESELKELLRIPSVSTDPDHDGDVRRAAEFVADQLKGIGLETEVIPTAGHPIVYAEWLGAEGAPTGDGYGQYHVKPPQTQDLCN